MFKKIIKNITFHQYFLLLEQDSFLCTKCWQTICILIACCICKFISGDLYAHFSAQHLPNSTLLNISCFAILNSEMDNSTKWGNPRKTIYKHKNYLFSSLHPIWKLHPLNQKRLKIHSAPWSTENISTLMGQECEGYEKTCFKVSRIVLKYWFKTSSISRRWGSTCWEQNWITFWVYNLISEFNTDSHSTSKYRI